MKPFALMLAAVLVTSLTTAIINGCHNSGPTASFPDAWFFDGNQPKLLGRPAPSITVTQWHGGDPLQIEDLKGHVVLLDFWGSWCGPCRRAMPHINDVADQFGSEGVRVIAVHSQRGHENMVKAADELGLRFPTAKDETGSTARDYGVPFWPFYVLIDRNGVVRAAGLNPEHVQEAVQALLAEQPPRKA